MKFDDILMKLGEFGFYQKRLYVLLCLPAISVGCFMMNLVFVMKTSDHRQVVILRINSLFHQHRIEIVSRFSTFPIEASAGYIIFQYTGTEHKIQIQYHRSISLIKFFFHQIYSQRTTPLSENRNSTKFLHFGVHPFRWDCLSPNCV